MIYERENYHKDAKKEDKKPQTFHFRCHSLIKTLSSIVRHSMSN